MKKTLLALAFLSASSASFADSWLYGGVSVGQSDFDGKDETAYSVHVGTGILPFIGVEGGYTNHGRFDISNVKGGGDVSLDSTYAAIKPSWNFGDLQVYAKGGVHRWTLDASQTSRFKNDDGYDVMWSVGADMEVFGPFALGANYTNYKMDGEDVGSYNLTATLHFF
ncbi:outer membrane beta-barrel protein [Parendozoicomonas haliclonae]|uniref:OmpA-like transmembrane domain protein n=1 Tax=Parendozoicomonas haliclonae TaxID=1960125 RepID=A0A1X7AGG8_9GAMM|nr:outer membrane beta-barrel protein [Parendozoicomonas haliclonae]SMA39666.1 OmpA-like transmembrane domain protein [Parendozoicomonas haliclonae]